MWLRVASTLSLESTEQALIKALDASEIPMPIEYLVPCDAGEVAAVVTAEETKFSRWVEETYPVPEGATFYRLSI